MFRAGTSLRSALRAARLPNPREGRFAVPWRGLSGRARKGGGASTPPRRPPPVHVPPPPPTPPPAFWKVLLGLGGTLLVGRYVLVAGRAISVGGAAALSTPIALAALGTAGLSIFAHSRGAPLGSFDERLLQRGGNHCRVVQELRSPRPSSAHPAALGEAGGGATATAAGTLPPPRAPRTQGGAADSGGSSEYRAAITSAICSTVPHPAGILLAGSLDGTVKVWR